MNHRPILEMVNISKEFPGVKALDCVDFDLRAGEVHALVGENGAGKSTLIKILAGVYQPDSGTVRLNGEAVRINDPAHAQAIGIATIHQERKLVPSLSAAENVVLGHFPNVGMGVVNWKRAYDRANELLKDRLAVQFDIHDLVRSLSVANQQLVEIAKALSLSPKIIIMDEPTASLTPGEADRLFEIIRNLKKDGVGIIYITHRLAELPLIADRITVMRDGKKVGHYEAGDVPGDVLVQNMVGRKLSSRYPKVEAHVGNEVLAVTGLTRRGAFEGVNLRVHSGEVVGIAGLVGSGRTEVARCIFGADRYDSGEIRVKGMAVRIRSISDALAHGVALAVEDRKRQGLILCMSVGHNITLASFRHIARLGWISPRKDECLARKYIADLGIRTPSSEQRVAVLSGGNQQKVVIAKWLASNFDVLILDEPTVGIDVGARLEIYHLINTLKRQGNGILLISSDLPEILGMSDRIYVMREGVVAGEMPRSEASQERIMALATGHGATA